MTGSSEHTIDDHAMRFLLALARETIRCRLYGKPLPSPELEDQVLLEPRGAFVTLKIDGRLRGCIGHVIGVEPLWRAVRDNAIAAAFEDPRFDPLEADELAPRPHRDLRSHAAAARCVRRGRSSAGMGFSLERGPARGLLLPQVAVGVRLGSGDLSRPHLSQSRARARLLAPPRHRHFDVFRTGVWGRRTLNFRFPNLRLDLSWMLDPPIHPLTRCTQMTRTMYGFVQLTRDDVSRASSIEYRGTRDCRRWV